MIFMETNNEMIPIDLHLNDFKQYLDANNRCILSAKFGNGKSYFISKFIEQYSDEYLFIPIYPVNYQVMDNKDIFELIKRDILIRLLSNDLVEVDNLNFNTAFLCYHFFVNNATDTILDILELIPSVNLLGVDINIGNVFKKTNDIKRKYETWKKNIIENTKDKSNSYIEHFKGIKGSIYEFDAISQLICDIIKEYRNNNPDKKVVLIIEDLDRIDPAHIFRILNVFSAHFDRYNISTSLDISSVDYCNKFCLDKIVSVCDLDNIKKIYAHVYGEKTDFWGYISKFSNSREFRYSLQQYLKDYIVNYLLNKDLLQYTNICNILSRYIVFSMDKNNSFEVNLRIIKSRIQNANSLIKDIKLYLKKPYNDLYVTSDSLLIYLLSLLKTFDLDFKILKQDSTKDELFFITGKFWFLITKFSDIFNFNFNNGVLDIYFKVDRHMGYFEWEKGHSFLIKNKEKELTDLNLLSFNVTNNHFANKMYNYIDDLVLYLSNEAII